MQTSLKKGDRVRFEYWDNDKQKEVFGQGRITEVDPDNGVVHIQTTRTLHWLEYDGQLKNITLI